MANKTKIKKYTRSLLDFLLQLIEKMITAFILTITVLITLWLANKFNLVNKLTN